MVVLAFNPKVTLLYIEQSCLRKRETEKEKKKREKKRKRDLNES